MIAVSGKQKVLQFRHGGERILRIYHKGVILFDTYLKVSPASLGFADTGGEEKVAVASNTSWNVT